VSFQDSDWTAQAEASPGLQPRRTSPYLAVAIGLALGIAIGATATLWVVQPRTGAGARPMAAPASAAAPVTAALPAASAVVVAPASSTPAPQVLAAEPLLPDPPAAGASPPLSAAEVARRKERAWDRFYRRPAACEGNPSAEQLVECGNHFIRSRREFEDRWRTGNL
jgi:hypothetical protein